MLRLDGRGKRHVRLLYVNIRHHPPTTTVVIVVIIVIIIIVITTGTSVANTVDITAISAARSSYYLICIIQPTCGHNPCIKWHTLQHLPPLFFLPLLRNGFRTNTH